MNLSPDQTIIWQLGSFQLNLTIATTWMLMLLLVIGALLTYARWKSFLESIILQLQTQMEELGLRPAKKYIGFLGTLFLFIATANVCTIFPGYTTPTSSLSTTAALAIAVFFSVLVFGISDQGIKGYLATYLKPTPLMLPINIISEFSRTLALAVRLFGNMMSGNMIVSILLLITPFFIPMIISLFGLVIGIIQAYIFTVLAAVYIAAEIQIRNT